MLTPEQLKKLRERAKKSHSHITVYGKEPEFVIVESGFMLELLDEIEQLEAQCAAMRKAVDEILHGSYTTCGELYEICQKALSGDAGRELLERMRKLERVAEAAREASKNGYVNYLTKNVLLNALAALDGDPHDPD